MRLKIDRKLPV